MKAIGHIGRRIGWEILLFWGFSLWAQITVVGELSHEYVLQPGERRTGAIEVMNLANNPQVAKVYQADYLYFADGTSRYDAPGTVTRSNAGWIEVSPRQMTVPPNEKVVVNYVIQVPDSGLAGSYWSLLMVEPAEEIQPVITQGVHIRTVVRYAIQILTQIGNTGEKDIRFAGAQLVRKEEGRFLIADIENTGTQYVQPLIWVEVFGVDGTFAGKFETRQARIFPFCSIRREIDLSSLKAGDYKALLVVDCGGEDLFGMNLTLKITP